MFDSSTKEKFIVLRSTGMSYGRIAKEIDVAKSTLIKWNNDFEEEISKRRDEYLNELRDKYLMSEIKRVKLFGERLKSVRAEIQKKGLGELKIQQLLVLEGKYVKRLAESYCTPRFGEKLFHSQETDQKWTKIDRFWFFGGISFIFFSG